MYSIGPRREGDKVTKVTKFFGGWDTAPEPGASTPKQFVSLSLRPPRWFQRRVGWAAFHEALWRPNKRCHYFVTALSLLSWAKRSAVPCLLSIYFIF